MVWSSSYDRFFAQRQKKNNLEYLGYLGIQGILGALGILGISYFPGYLGYLGLDELGGSNKFFVGIPGSWYLREVSS